MHNQFDEKSMEKHRNELMSEMSQLNREIVSSRRKKFAIVSIVLVLLIIFIKTVFGTIQIYNVFGYPRDRIRFYKLTVNDKAISVDYNLNHNIPIVPFLINFSSNYVGSNDIKGDNDGVYYYPDGSEKYIIDINSYSCYSNDYQVECKNDKQTMKENNDTKYTNLTITRTNNPYEEVYNGEFIHDITPYVKEKGVYCVEVTAKHFLVETKVYFYFKR